MDIQTIKAMFDACYQAKRIRDLLPALPEGVTPSYIHYLDTIESLEQRSGARGGEGAGIQHAGNPFCGCPHHHG